MEAFEEEPFCLWQDRDIKFDSNDKALAPRPGETVISKFEAVEDTKGNNGASGKLTVTNLRIIWRSTAKPSVNLSIGLMCIFQIKARKATSKLRGQTESVYILTKCKKTQFEFIFTNLVSDTPKLFALILAVHRSYETSKLYREIKLRGAIIDNQTLKVLPLEQVYDKINGVMNLCSSQGTLGTMYITNVRVAWHANTNEAFNISVPYLHLISIKMRESKFGLALVLETHKDTGGYVLGFRIDPQEKLRSTLQQINSLYRVFSAHPIFGVEYETDESVDPSDTTGGDSNEKEGGGAPFEDESEIVETSNNVCSAYFADPNKSHDREPFYSEHIGLAMETLPDGYSIKDLWEVT
ncbi:PREDICTED: Bardet-Biedl syndrome 5 protein homolog [Amphimedon queenslandica]|uniref:BBSome complex member BBS5 PH domain-containing protein n=2 Tax=Amphimedon queenslandica TaxID=400682 RepID=A0A1X7V028_AMPQE|nr:PREDICTED: Bardet-Biedl syndrome 5 protein homolog [Amphimedon queenslandica]|eukprot:XP_003386094.1 PREDICTED: Bardet-Biedl syndrome 5 protein homolog [Amphimedon queenslandica]